jgi:hypothetical protein
MPVEEVPNPAQGVSAAAEAGNGGGGGGGGGGSSNSNSHNATAMTVAEIQSVINQLSRMLPESGGGG